MKLLPLTRGYVALVDDVDFERVNQFKWSAVVGKHTVYAGRYRQQSEFWPTKWIALHRFVLNVTDSKIEVDHHDRNGLNCQTSNLRKCTRSRNNQNRIRQKRTTKSGFKGVTPRYGKWRAAITVNGKLIDLGRFEDKKDAALEYDKAAQRYFGEFALLNFPANS